MLAAVSICPLLQFQDFRPLVQLGSKSFIMPLLTEGKLKLNADTKNVWSWN